MPSPAEFFLEPSQGTRYAFCDRLTPELETSSPVPRAIVREPEEIESLRSTLTGARYGMIATVDDAGAIREFVASGLSAHECRHMADWPHRYRFFEHLRDLPGALRLADVPAYVRSLGYCEELTLSKTLQAMPMRHRGVHAGNFVLGEKEGGQEFTGEDEEVLVLFASQAAIRSWCAPS